MKINERGYWEDICNHHTDIGLMNVLPTILQESSSIVDFGCGDGSYIKHIHSTLDIKTKAFDGNPHVNKITNGFATQLDLSQPFNLNEKFDVVMSLEVAEHIPTQYESIYINNIINHTNKYIIISWAIPYQGGKGHVNERSNTYVINTFQNKNFKHLESISNHLRNCVTNCHWFKNTLFVFENNN